MTGLALAVQVLLSISLFIRAQQCAVLYCNALFLSCVKGLGQLLVWEWQSESYVFKQQGHFNNMNSLAYSPDGQYIVTGGDDGKVSLLPLGFCRGYK